MAAPLRAVGPNEEDLSPAEQEEILSQSIAVQIGGQPKRLPIRTIKQEREWMGIALQKAGEMGEINLDLSPAGYTSMMALGNEAVLDLVIEYDRTNALGGREYIEAHASRREIYVILRRLIDEHFPFGGDLSGLLEKVQGVQGILALARINSAQAKSGSGSEPSGNRAVRRSKKPSPVDPSGS